MMGSRVVILLTVIALILDRCDSSTSLDAVDSLTIAVRFEHSEPLENLEQLHSFVREMTKGASERGIERVAMIEFGGGADSSPSGMVVRDLGDDDEIGKKEELVAEFGRKLAAIKNVRAERLTDIARRSRREKKDSSSIVLVVSMTAAIDPKGDIREQQRRELRSMATRALRNGADIVVFLSSSQKSADSQLNAVYFWKFKNSSVATGEWNESDAATTASSIGAKIFDAIDELIRKRGKTRRRRNQNQCPDIGRVLICYYTASKKCEAEIEYTKGEGEQYRKMTACNDAECKKTCDDKKEWTNGKCKSECKSRKKMTPSSHVKHCPVKKPCPRRAECAKSSKLRTMIAGAVLFLIALFLVLALGIGFGVLIFKIKKPAAFNKIFRRGSAKTEDVNVNASVALTLLNPPSFTQTPMEDLYKQGSKKPGSPQQQNAATFVLGAKSAVKVDAMANKSTIAKAGASVRADPKVASADPKAVPVKVDPKAAAPKSSKSAKAPPPASVKKK